MAQINNFHIKQQEQSTVVVHAFNGLPSPSWWGKKGNFGKREKKNLHNITVNIASCLRSVINNELLLYSRFILNLKNKINILKKKYSKKMSADVLC